MKRIILMLCAVMAIYSCDNTREDLIITGKVKGIKKGKLYLQFIKDSAVVNIDSVSFYNNEDYEFSVELYHPQAMYLQLQRDTIESGDNFISFFADKGNLKIESTLENFSLSKIISDYDNQKVFDEYSKTYNRFSEVRLDLIKAELEARKNNDQVMLDSVNQAYDRMNKRKILFAVNFAKSHPNLEVSPYILLSQAQFINKKYLDSTYNMFDKKVQNSLYGKQLKELLSKN